MNRTRKRSTVTNALAGRFPVTLTAADLIASPAVTDMDPPQPIDFVAVPRRRNRRGGWSEKAQRAVSHHSSWKPDGNVPAVDLGRLPASRSQAICGR